MLILTFLLGPERFALDAACIRQVLPQVPLAALPRLADYVTGVFDCGGTLVPVVDLGLLLRGVPCSSRLSTRIVVVEPTHDGRQVALGLLAECVIDLVSVETGAQIQPPSAGQGFDCVTSILRLQNELVQWIDVNRILPTALRSRLYDEILAEAPQRAPLP